MSSEKEWPVSATPDKSVTCKDCSTAFVFTGREPKLTRTSRALRTVRTAPASCVPYEIEGTGQLAARRHARYVRGTRTSLGRT